MTGFQRRCPGQPAGDDQVARLEPVPSGPELLREARDVFPATVAPRDFDTIEVPHAERGGPALVKGGALPERAGDKVPAA